MTVQELIDKLDEIPEAKRQIIVVRLETENEIADLTDLTARCGGSRMWWDVDHIILSGRY